MIESKYRNQFNRLSELKIEILRGATLLVEVLPKQELKSAGGLFLAAGIDSHKATSDDYRRALGLVLLQGEGYADGTKMDIKPGYLILMPFAPMYLSEFPGMVEYTANTLAIVNENDVILSFKSAEDFEKASAALNAK